MKQLLPCFLALLLSLWPMGAHAQSSQDDPFCIVAGTDLLIALDGAWTLSQGPGFAAAAGMVIPLPPHPGKSVNITYDPDLMGAVMRADGQQMLLLPTPSGMVQNAMQFLNEAEAEGLLGIGDGCDFFELPIVLGSTTYDLQNGASSVPGYALGIGFGGEIEIICVQQTHYDTLLGEPTLSEPGGLQGSTQVLQVDEENETAMVLIGGENQICANMAVGVSDPGPGQMVMSLAVKFQSDTFGTGMLYFVGSKNGHRFAAKAPITFTR